MTLGEFAVFGVSVFLAIWIVAKAYSDSHPTQLTVEAEQERSRDVIATIGQHHPTVDDDDDSIPFLLDTIDERDAWLARHGIGRGFV